MKYETKNRSVRSGLKLSRPDPGFPDLLIFKNNKFLTKFEPELFTGRVEFDLIDEKGNLIPIMQNIQEIEGFLSKESIKLIAKKTGISVAEIYGVATFYSLFRLKPQGKHIIRVCQGTACHVGNSKDILRAVREKLNLNETDETTADNEFTIM